MNTAYWVWSVIFSSLGLGYFMYGKKQGALVPLGCGIVLMAFPYFVRDMLPLVLIGVTLIMLPFVVRL